MWEGEMDEPMRLRCACGWETSGGEAELVEAAIEHGRRIHNMTPTREEVLAMVITEPPRNLDTEAGPPGARPAGS